MTDINIHDLDTQLAPFFTRYLETQSQDLSPEEMSTIQGGAIGIGIINPTDIGKDALTVKGGVVSHGDQLSFPLFPPTFI